MRLQQIYLIGYCGKCDAALVIRRGRYVCPNRRLWNFGHYRGIDDRGFGVGAYSSYGFREIEVPDTDNSWTPITDPPTVAGDYETLDSRTGRIAFLFKSVQSGGWWYPAGVDRGHSMWDGLVTHWRSMPK